MAKKKNIYNSILYQAKRKNIIVEEEKIKNMGYNLIKIDKIELNVFHWTFLENEDNEKIELWAIYPGINRKITEPLENADLEKVYDTIKGM